LDFKRFLREFKDCSKNQKENKNIWAIDEDFDPEEMVAFKQKEEDNVICCCKSHIPHDESMKFILLVEDPKYENLVIFKNR